MRTLPLTSRGLTLPAIVTLVLLTVLAALVAGASAVSAQGTVPDAPDLPIGTAVFAGGVDLEWNDVPAADSYDVQLYRNGQWIDLPGDGVEIAFYGAGAIISGLDPDSTLWFQVRARNAHGSSDWSDFSSMASTNQFKLGRRDRPDNVSASGAPVINGTAQAGETLTADTTGIEDENGLDRVQFRFQWVSHDGSADTDIAGATDSTYTLAASEEGKSIKVQVAFTDRGGYAESLTSAATATVAAAPNSPATGAPAIPGTAEVGKTLTADTSGIADADGLTKVSYSYQWVANDGTADTDITYATDSTYTLAAADEGRTVKVKVSFTDDAGNEETLTSSATAAVDAAPNTPATGAPAISGTAQVGETLTTDTSGISDADGLAGATFAYQWLADGAGIAGATGDAYVLTTSEMGKTIKVRVSFTDDAGNEETLTSTATGTVSPAVQPQTANNPATGVPAATGTAQVGETLTVDTSSIDDDDGLTNVSYSYQWIRNDGSTDTDIQNATDATYTLAADDEGKTIKVRVSFTDDAANEESLTSEATAEVAAAGPPPDITAAVTEDTSERTVNLGSLSITDENGTAIDFGTFDPAVQTYSANVASTVERVTVTARPESSSNAYVNLAPGDYGSDDNLWEVEGRNVSLNHGRNLILIGVFSYWVDEPLRVYTVEINRAGSATSGAENHISSSSLSTAREGSTVPFLLTRSGDVSAALTVPVDVWSTDDTNLIHVVPHIDPVTILKRVEVEFQAGSASAIWNHETTDDSLYTGGYHLGVTLIEGTGYRVPPFYGSGRFASTLVWDNDINKPNLELLSLTDQNGGGVAIGEFDPDLTSYSGSVGSEVTHVTVTQSTTERSRFASRVLPPDSQPNVAGHQVALQHGANLVSVILMAPFHDDAVTSGTYDVIVTRAGSPSGTPTPTVSVYGLGDAKEGYTMPFILARTGDTSQSLTVPVNVSETGGDLVPQASEGSSDVVFPAGSASARIEVPTVADQDWEEHSTVTVAVVDGTGYELSSQSGSASSTVKDNDVPAVTAAFTVDSGQPQEGDVVTASVTVTTDGPKQPHGYVGNLDFSAELGSAQQEDLHIPFDSNDRNFPEGHRVTGSYSYGGSDPKSASFPVNQQAMQPVESDGVITHYQYQFSVPILVVDDERAEADETFDISVEWDSYSRGRTLIMDQGITSRTVTIQEHDDTPASPKLKPRWDLHFRGADHKPGCPDEALPPIHRKRSDTVSGHPTYVHFTLALV